MAGSPKEGCRGDVAQSAGVQRRDHVSRGTTRVGHRLVRRVRDARRNRETQFDSAEPCDILVALANRAMRDYSNGIFLFGASDHARCVADIVERDGKYRICGLFDSRVPKGTTVRGYEVLGAEAEMPSVVAKTGICKGIVAI